MPSVAGIGTLGCWWWSLFPVLVTCCLKCRVGWPASVRQEECGIGGSSSLELGR